MLQGNHDLKGAIRLIQLIRTVEAVPLTSFLGARCIVQDRFGEDSWSLGEDGEP